jgi:hypothetical protein
MNIVMSRRQFISRLVRFQLIQTWSVPTPSLQLGAWVRYSWVNDDRIDTKRFGQTEYLVGRVVGQVWERQEWNYFVEGVYSSYPADVFSSPEKVYADELEVLG